MAGGGNISVVIGDFLASGSNIAHCISADIKNVEKVWRWRFAASLEGSIY